MFWKGKPNKTEQKIIFKERLDKLNSFCYNIRLYHNGKVSL